ncbi:MAG: hypothetical protein LUE64_05980 [Candidatus Gastranaerophilales bacterium]|nr:hypothetical protein [Candidatus Gastranaerophilales bacterium]
MKITQLLKKQSETKKRQKLEKQEKFLKKYFSRLYAKNDAGKVEIPFFIKAQQTVEDLKKRGLIEDVFKYISKRGQLC